MLAAFLFGFGAAFVQATWPDSGFAQALKSPETQPFVIGGGSGLVAVVVWFGVRHLMRDRKQP